MDGDMVSRATEIYPFKKMIQRELLNIKSDPHNSDCMLKYYYVRVAEGISEARIYKCLSTVRRLSHMLDKPFIEATKDDFIKLISDLESRDLGEWAKRDAKVILKHFYKWLRNWEDGAPPEVRWIKKCAKAENRNPILPKDLLTQEEKIRMLRATQNPRDRALLEVLFESGRRPEEILTLHIKDIEFDSIGAKIYINGKMGEDFARVISSSRALAIWIDNHPRRDDPDSPVWVGFGTTNRMKQINYSAARALLKKITKRAGIKKRVKFYLFRHTRVDETQGILTESQQCVMFGWKFGSNMPAVYMKRYGKHIDNAQAIMNGLSPPVKQVTVAKPKECPRCTMENSPVSLFCNRCGSALDIVTALKMDEANRIVERAAEQLRGDPKKMRQFGKALVDT